MFFLGRIFAPRRRFIIKKLVGFNAQSLGELPDKGERGRSDPAFKLSDIRMSRFAPFRQHLLGNSPISTPLFHIKNKKTV
jgi:hypothetical protein